MAATSAASILNKASATLSSLMARNGSGTKPSSAVQKPKKRKRRTAREIDRRFPCSVRGCSKAYGSEGALKMHMRLKHDDVYRTMNLRREMNDRRAAYSKYGTAGYQSDVARGSAEDQSSYAYRKISPAMYGHVRGCSALYPGSTLAVGGIPLHEQRHAGPTEAPVSSIGTMAYAQPVRHSAAVSIAMLQIGLWRRHDDSSESLQLLIDYATQRFRYLSQFGEQHFEIQVPFGSVTNLKLEAHSSHLGVTLSYNVRVAPQFAVNGQSCEDFTGCTDSFWKPHFVLFSKHYSFAVLLSMFTDSNELLRLIEVVPCGAPNRAYGEALVDGDQWEGLPTFESEEGLFKTMERSKEERSRGNEAFLHLFRAIHE